jgi:hypothetical protein
MVAQLVEEGLAPGAGEARQLLRLAGGNLADARALADAETRAFRRELIDSLGQPRLDSVGIGQKLDKFAEEGVKESATKRQRATLALKFLIGFLRAALVAKQGGQPDLADPEDAQTLRRFVDRIDEERLLQMLDRCLEADYQIARRLQLVLILEALTDALAEAA